MIHSYGPIETIVRKVEKTLLSPMHVVAAGLFGEYDGSSSSARNDNQQSALYPPTTVRGNVEFK
jgi:hypothetical protein